MTERQSKLIKLVNLYQKIEVSRLAELLDVSQVTIRKDLDHLEEEGLLSREHGYALIKNANDINTRLTINYDKKIEIATKAAEMVSNGETVMLESGSTCTLLAEQLAKLKKDARIIFMRRYWFGDSIQEISDQYGYGTSKIKMSLMRSRKELKKVLDEEGFLE